MACRSFKADGVQGILCGGRAPRPLRCSQKAIVRPARARWAGASERCLFPAVALCDYPTGKGRTCSAKICGDHRTERGGVDFCPAHAGVFTLPGVK